MERNARILVAGGGTPIGTALCRALRRQGYAGLIGGPEAAADLTEAAEVEALFNRTAPEYVFVTAVRSGGIRANQKYPAMLMRDNLLAASHVIDGARRHGVKKLLYLASSCVYPRHAPQPMHEGLLLTGPLEPTSEAYAVARITGIKLCQAYRRQYGMNCVSAIAADAFGPDDEFDPEDSHVIPALIRKMHEAKTRGAPAVEVWGSGTPRRDFLFADDAARACLLIMDRYEDPEPINIGSGTDRSVREIAELIRDVVGYAGELVFDADKPDGMPLKRLDGGKLRAMGWQPATPLRDALAATYRAFLERQQVGESGHVRTVL